MTDLLATVRPDLTYAEARELTDSICAQVSELLPKLGEAFERRAWVALGYESWDSYCADEFRGLRWPVEDRQAAVVELAGKGMSRRAIGSALGVDEKTVRNDLRGAEFSAPPTVVGADGKEQPATKPTNERLTPPPAVPAAEVFDLHEDDPEPHPLPVVEVERAESVGLVVRPESPAVEDPAEVARPVSPARPPSPRGDHSACDFAWKQVRCDFAWKQVRCDRCGREYQCTPADDHYCAAEGDHCCEPCLLGGLPLTVLVRVKGDGSAGERL